MTGLPATPGGFGCILADPPWAFLEMFARTTRPGWSGWGLETDKFSVKPYGAHPTNDCVEFGGPGIPLEVVTPHRNVSDRVAVHGSEAVDAG